MVSTSPFVRENSFFTGLTIGLILLGTIVYGVALLLTRTIGKSELKLLPMGDKICAWLIRLRLLPE